MGLLGDNCDRCREAAENDKGLAGRWWRFWAEVRFGAPWTLIVDSELTEPPRRDTGERQLWLYWCWNCGDFRARREWMVWGPVGVCKVEKASDSFYFCALIPISFA